MSALPGAAGPRSGRHIARINPRLDAVDRRSRLGMFWRGGPLGHRRHPRLPAGSGACSQKPPAPRVSQGQWGSLRMMSLHPQRTAGGQPQSWPRGEVRVQPRVSGTHAVGMRGVPEAFGGRDLKGPKARTINNQMGPSGIGSQGCRASPGAFSWALLHLSLCQGVGLV